MFLRCLFEMSNQRFLNPVCICKKAIFYISRRCLGILARQLLEILQIPFGPLSMQTLRLHIPFLLIIVRESNGKYIF